MLRLKKDNKLWALIFVILFISMRINGNEVKFQGVLIIKEMGQYENTMMWPGFYLKFNTFVAYEFQNIKIKSLKIGKSEYSNYAIHYYNDHFLIEIKGLKNISLNDDFKLNLTYEYAKIEILEKSFAEAVISPESIKYDINGINLSLKVDKEKETFKLLIKGEVEGLRIFKITDYTKKDRTAEEKLTLSYDNEQQSFVYTGFGYIENKILTIGILSKEKKEGTLILNEKLFEEGPKMPEPFNSANYFDKRTGEHHKFQFLKNKR